MEQHRSYAPDRLGFAALTVSDSRTPADDGSGDIVERLVAEAGHRLVERRIVRDESEVIRSAVEELMGRAVVDVLVVSGGTGLAPRDVTIEAIEPCLGRPIPGFGELFRMLSWEQVGAAAMLSRAIAGVCGTSVVFVLPGSPRAVELALAALILPEAAHLLGQVRRDSGAAVHG